MERDKTLDNIEVTRNTNSQIDWYNERQSYLDNGRLLPHLLADIFPVFSTRQKVTRMLETLRYWELVENIPGDIFECGVAGGEFLMSMAHFSSIYEPHHYTRKIVGFDTFDGFTEPSEQDRTSNAKHMKSGGLSYDSYGYLEKAIEFYDQNRLIGNIGKVFLVKGDISLTLPEYLEKHPSTVIGLLHLDIDLYRPTLDVLKAVRRHMAKGSIIVFDEINHLDYPGETLAVMEALGLENIGLKRVREASMAAYTIL
ncbi:TylF/MycF/NovP-related O-methyltransferase [Labrenzia sp. CE80]|uniref:TylF/MycF/NovP-related O-methyltransferase n=1 Tax=Labrenzia sp. CE80 TaxID=1788986 RepID=UPI00129BC631|nr:TylF/MycF/NovP-related O-methyltransferase [Labrenzia sp. CE80]